jgi:hypothetical protein
MTTSMKNRGFPTKFVLLAAMLGGSVTARAAETVLTFDNIAAHDGNNLTDVIREDYSSLGVHFNSDGRHSGIVRLGISQGDPGSWRLEGSNGPQFLGHNNYGRTGLITFDAPVEHFRIDAAHGSVGVRNLTFTAYGSSGLLEQVTLAQTSPGAWATISLTSTGITRIEYTSPSNFGLDNMRFEPVSVPEPGTFALLAAGGVGLTGWARKRRRAR